MSCTLPQKCPLHSNLLCFRSSLILHSDLLFRNEFTFSGIELHARPVACSAAGLQSLADSSRILASKHTHQSQTVEPE